MNEHYITLAEMLDEYVDKHEVTYQDMEDALKLYIKSMKNRKMAGKADPHE